MLVAYFITVGRCSMRENLPLGFTTKHRSNQSAHIQGHNRIMTLIMIRSKLSY